MTAIVTANVALIVAATTVGVIAHRSQADGSDDEWPAFWFAVATIALLLLVGQAVDAGELLADVGRRQARTAGWYQSRSVLQTALIAAVLIGATVVAAVAAVAVRRRRGRLAACAPAALLTGALVAYAAVRIVSLHAVDAIANKVGPGGFTLGDTVEFLLLAAMLAVCLHHLVRIVRRSRHPEKASPELRPQ